MSKNVIELIRVSTEAQAAKDRAGIPAQRTANRRTAAQHGLTIVKSIEITDVSGAAVLYSPGMRNLLSLIESPEMPGVVVKEFSRLMRPENLTDYALLQAFVDTGTILYLPDGPIDFRSKSGRLLGTIRAAIAGLERTEILERSWAAKEEKRRAGKHPQGWITLPFGVGYDPQEDHWYYGPEAEKVREAFRLFLSGECSYWGVGRKLGIDPPNLRIILRNPIYTGWRVYTYRRDPSAGAIRTKPDGRQADRPKIRRAPEEEIRVKVLDPPLVSTEDFQRVQQILDLKKQNHWRVRPDYEHRFVYNGFLRCAGCKNLMYTHVRPPKSDRPGRDWYICKSRTTAERRAREAQGLDRCLSPYMLRQRLERGIDDVLSVRLSDPHFLVQVANAYLRESTNPTTHTDPQSIQLELERLEEKRHRVLDAYFDTRINRTECDRRLADLDADKERYEDLLVESTHKATVFSPSDLAELFAPFLEWEFLQRGEKRKLLQAITPEIHVRDYRVAGISVAPDSLNRNEVSRTDTGS
jgi:DNA invertase Pin-like site-specific DNA recombinase